MDGVETEVSPEVEVESTEQEAPETLATDTETDNNAEEPSLSKSLTSTGEETEEGAEEPADDSTEEAAGLFTDVSLPEGVALDTTALEAFEPLLKEFDVSTEQAQSFADAYLRVQESRYVEANKAIESERNQHAQALKEDPEFGGDNFDNNMKHVALAVKNPEGQELAKVMLDYGLDNHPSFIKYLASIGQNLREDSIIGGGSRAAGGIRAADALFPKTAGQ